MTRPLPLLLALVVLAPAARAEHPRAPLTFDEALVGAQAAPDVAGATAAAAVKARANEAISRATENPELTVTSGYRLLAPEDRGGELHVGVQQGFNVSGLAGARRHAARAEHAVLTEEARARALARRLEAADAWVGLWTVERLAEALGRERAVANELQAALAEGLRRGAVTKADEADGRAFVAELGLAQLAVEGATFEAAVRLAREAAWEPGRLPTTAGPLPEPALPSDERCAELAARVEALPALRVAELQARAEEARAQETKAAYGTRLTAGLQLEHDAPGGLLALGSLGVSWGALDRGERERGSQMARAHALRGDLAARRLEAGHAVTAALHEVRHTREQERALADVSLPALREVAALRQRELETGQGVVLDVLQARRRVVAAEGGLARARGERIRAELHAWLLLRALGGG